METKITIVITQKQLELLQHIMLKVKNEYESGSDINPKKEFDIRELSREIWLQSKSQIKK
jgi:hypothetical protein